MDCSSLSTNSTYISDNSAYEDTKEPCKTGLNNNTEDLLYTLNTPVNDDTLHEHRNTSSNHPRRPPDRSHSRGKRLESINEDSECFSSVIRNGSISSMSFTAIPFSGFQVPEATVVPVSDKKGCRTKRLSAKEAIPVMPLSLAVLCLIFNILIPGSGTIVSGFVAFCMSQEEAMYDKMAVLCVNCFVGLAQMATVVFLMVGWFWSITWGCAFVGLSANYGRKELPVEHGSTQFSLEEHSVRHDLCTPDVIEHIKSKLGDSNPEIKGSSC